MMANYFTQFSCIFDVGSEENVTMAKAIYRDFEDELSKQEGSPINFRLEVEIPHGPGALWIHSDEDGEPEHVIKFVLQCAEKMNLSGLWGFTWGLSCSRPRLHGFGGGAQVLDLGRRKTLNWINCSNWVTAQTGVTKGSSADIESNAISVAEVAPESVPAVGRFFEVSSGHLSPQTWQWLYKQLADQWLRDSNNADAVLIAGGRMRYGWFVYAPADASETLPADLRTAMATARTAGAEYILFDCDVAPDRNLVLVHPDFRN